MSPRTVSYSKTTLTELMIPSYANFGGKVHGGILLSLMDKVAYTCASKHAACYVVTVSVDEVNFLAPVNVGELVSLHAAVNHVGKSSIVVGIRVIAENVKTGEQKHTNTSYFTMVAKDDNNKPTEVPELILETREDVRRCVEAVKRKKIKAENRHQFENEFSDANLDKEIDLLKEERVLIQKSI